MYRLSFLLFFISSIVNSAELETTTTIKTLFLGPDYDHLVFVGVDDKPTQSRPAGCGNNGNFDFVLDLRETYAKEYYSALLTAYMSKKNVRLTSYDSCNNHPSIPDLKHIWLK